MALILGWSVKSVKLLPFGGVVEVDDSSGGSAKEELLVAFAGPMQNAWMAALAWALGEFGMWPMEWSEYLVQANLWLVAFNMLPILPLDGGKIMMALISYKMQYFNCLIWCAKLSIVSSSLLMVYSLMPLVLFEGGIKLNEFMIGIFLLFSNITYYRHIPFIFYRFLLFRRGQIVQLEQRGVRVTPLLVQSRQNLYDTFKRIKREQLHLLCIVDQHSQKLKMVSEQETLIYCGSSNLHRAVGEVFR